MRMKTSQHLVKKLFRFPQTGYQRIAKFVGICLGTFMDAKPVATLLYVLQRYQNNQTDNLCRSQEKTQFCINVLHYAVGQFIKRVC